jgi:hypothetical protein
MTDFHSPKWNSRPGADAAHSKQAGVYEATRPKDKSPTRSVKVYDRPERPARSLRVIMLGIALLILVIFLVMVLRRFVL